MIRAAAALTLLLSAVALTAQQPAQQRTIVAVSDGWAEAVVELPEQARTVWIWSADCAPARMLSTDEWRCGEIVERSVRVSVPPKQQTNGLELRWGTEEMLRDLPDALLPLALIDEQGTARLRVPKGKDVFARIAGPRLASGWKLLGNETRLAAVAASPVAIAIPALPRDANRAWVEIRTSDAPQPRELRFRGLGRGRVTIPPIPSSSYVKLVAWSETNAPAVVSARADAIPQSIELPPGQELRGAVTDDADKPLANAAVTVLFLLPRDPQPIRKRTQSGADGSFRLRGLPKSDVELTIAREPFATSTQIVPIAGDSDLGRVMLDRRRTVTFVVLDGQRTPIGEATIETATGVKTATNAKGAATLKDVSAGPFDVAVTARGFLSRTISIASDIKQPLAVQLERAAQVRARLVDRVHGTPVHGGTIAVDLDHRTHVDDFEDDRIEIGDLKAGTLSLEIRPHGLSPFRLPERRIAAGEVVDLGVIQLEPGVALTGRALDAVTREPLAGVSVRVLRPSELGALMAWFRRDVVSAESGVDGTFRVAGLAPGTYALWTEAAGRAPAIRTGIVLSDEAASADKDLGDLAIEEGRRVIVSCTPGPRCGSEAVLTPPDAEWFEISSPMLDGYAEIAPVPSGSASLRLSQGGGVIHQREIEVAKEPATEVSIRLEGATIAGRIMRGGRPVSGGTVVFSLKGSNAPFIQVAQKRPAGVVSNDILGAVPRRLTAMVGTGGAFELADVPPGEYTVVWSRAGAPSAPRKAFVPEGVTALPMTIELGSASLAGTVRRVDGTPVSDATVIVGDAKAVTGMDGTFSFTALDPGDAKVRAITRTEGSGEAAAQLRENEVTEVELKIKPDARNEAKVLVVLGGKPLPNVFVFVARNGRVSAATTSADGRATVRLIQGDGPVQIGAYDGARGWTFVPSRTVEDAEIVIEATAGTAPLTVHGETLTPLFITAPNGFPIHEALTILGSRPIARPSVPYVLPSLPPGAYSVSAGNSTKTVTIASKPADVRF